MLITMIKNHHIEITDNDSILETYQDTESMDSRRFPNESIMTRGIDKENKN